MPSIGQLSTILSDGLPGVTIFPIMGKVEAGVPQRVLVRLCPYGEIPLHSHGVDAMMVIVAGGGQVLSTDRTHGQAVVAGNTVFFERSVPHGFVAGPEGLAFISENGGIVDESGLPNWDIDFSVIAPRPTSVGL